MEGKINNNKLEDIEANRGETSAMSFEIDKSAELEKLSGDIKFVKDKIDYDQAINSGDVKKIASSLENMVIEIGGEKVSIGYLKNKRDLPENVKIYIEILNGNFNRTNELTSINVSIAMILAKSGKNIYLKNLASISDEVAEILSNSKGEMLTLHCLTSITDETAKSLAKYDGTLFLDGLTSISDQSAEALAKSKGNFHIGITSISNRAAEFLSKSGGEYITFSGLTSISSHEAAKSLARYNGQLWLHGLKSIDYQIAEALAKHKGALGLSSLKSIDDQVAEAISKHKGFIDLSGLASISDRAAEALARHEGRIQYSNAEVMKQIEKFKNQ